MAQAMSCACTRTQLHKRFRLVRLCCSTAYLVCDPSLLQEYAMTPHKQTILVLSRAKARKLIGLCGVDDGQYDELQMAQHHKPLLDRHR